MATARPNSNRPTSRASNRPHGLAFHDGALYIADIRAVWRVAYKTGDLKAGERLPVTRPGALGTPGAHWTRNVVFSPDGRSFFVAVGSASNVGEDPEPFATVQRFNADGSQQTTFAAGLRNPVGIAFYPGTNNLYVVVNERDGLGDGLVPDYLTRVEAGQFYGWPYAYIGKNPDPDFGAKRPGPRPEDGNARPALRKPFGARGPRLLRRGAVSGGLSRRRVRRFARLVEFEHSPPATRSCSCPSRTARPRAITRTS